MTQANALAVKAIASLEDEDLEAIKNRLPVDCREAVQELKLIQYLTPKELSTVATLFPNVTTLSFFVHKQDDAYMYGQAFAAFKNLHTLRLDGINDEWLLAVNLRETTTLTRLDIMSNSVRGLHFDTLPSTLKTLRLVECELENSALSNLRHLSQLEELALDDCFANFSLEGIPVTVRKLTCSNCELNDERCVPLEGLINLEELDLSRNDQVTTLQHVPKSVKKLNIGQCGFTDEPAINFEQLFPSLIKLDIHGNHKMWPLASLPASLKGLNLSYCYMASDTLERLQNLTSLQKLNISHAASINSLEQVPRSVKRLYARFCELNDDGIFCLREFHSLERLDIVGSEKITGATFEQLPASLKELRADRDIPTENLDKLRKRLPHIKIDHLTSI